MLKDRLKILLLAVFIVSCGKYTSESQVSDRAKTLYDKGMQCWNRLDYTHSLNYFKQAYQADTSYAMAAYQVLLLKQTLNEQDSLDFFADRSYKLSETLPEPNKSIVRIQYANYKDDDQTAKKLMAFLEENYFDDFDVKFLIAMHRWTEGYFVESRKIFLEMVKRKKDYVLGYNALGYLYANDGFYRESYKYFNKYIEAVPEQLNPYDSMAELLIFMGKYKEVIDLVEKVRTNQSENLKINSFVGTRLFLRKADALFFTGQHQRAYALLDSIGNNPAFKPFSLIIRLQKFAYYRMNENAGGMQREFEEIKGTLTRLQYHFYKCQTDIYSGNFSDAFIMMDTLSVIGSEFNSALRRQQFMANIASLEGDLNYYSGFYSEAAEKYKTAANGLRQFQYATRYHQREFIADGKSGELKKAIAGLNSLLELNPNNPYTLYYHSEFLLQNKQIEEAAASLNLLKLLWKNADEDIPLKKKINQLDSKIFSLKPR